MSPSFVLRASAFLLTVFAIPLCAEPSNASDQLATLPLEQLMQFKIDSVSKYPQQVSEAPASISIVTAQDIKAFGYRTLGDILASMRGLYVSYDRNYSYLGVRGFSVPGDYNTRVLLLIDGVRYNDDVYDQVPLGTDFPIDVALIERVEFIAGPTSAVYGSNALLGVINIVTKSGADFRGLNVSAGAGSLGTSRGRATLGNADAGENWLLSATRSNQAGQNLYYSEFDTPAQNNGIAEDADYDRSTSLFGKYQREDLAVTLTHVDRTKGIPTASYGQTFNDNRAQTIDVHTNLGVQYWRDITTETHLTARLYAGRYRYVGNYIYDDSQLENRDETRGDWNGGELQTAFTQFARQTIVVGGEYRLASHSDQKNFNVYPRAMLLDDQRHSHALGIYAQDDIAIYQQLVLNLGARADRLATSEWVGSPRIGLIYRPATDTSIKFLYGTAYRAPNTYEQYYYPQLNAAQGALATSDESLKRERISSKEFIVEHAFDASQRASFSLFRNDIEDLITLRSNPIDDSLYFINEGEAHTEGAEFEWQAAWFSGQRIKASYTWQQTLDAHDDILVNSPRNLIKLNFGGVLSDAISYGIDFRAAASRKTLGGDVAGYGITDFTLRDELTSQIEVSGTLYNLFDHKYADPGSSEHVQDSIAQNRRTFLINVDYWF